MKDSAEVTSESRPHGGANIHCKVLLEVATPSLYLKNAFRVLNLPVLATSREILKQGERMRQRQELGIIEPTPCSAFSLSDPATADETRDALQRLQDPEKRLIDEFFWFWPESYPASSEDPALLAIQRGDKNAALQIWNERASSQPQNEIAVHNLAISWHLRALDLETEANHPQRRTNARKELAMLWPGAIQRWKAVYADSALWDRIAQRVQLTGQVRITSGFLYRMRESLLYGIGKINAERALMLLNSGETEWAARHVEHLRAASPNDREADRTAELVLASPTERLKQQILLARQRAEANPLSDIHAARELAAYAVAARSTFDTLYTQGAVCKRELYNELVRACNQLVVKASERGTLDAVGLGVLRLVEPLAAGTEQQHQIAQNIAALEVRVRSQRGPASIPPAQSTATENTSSSKSAPPPLPNEFTVAHVLRANFGEPRVEAIVKMFQRLEETSQSPSDKMANASALVFKLQRALESISPNAEAWWLLSGAATRLLRAITREALQQGNVSLAKEANTLAQRFAKDPKDWLDVKKDRTDIEQASEKRQSPQTPKTTPTTDSWTHKFIFGIALASILILLIPRNASTSKGGDSMSSEPHGSQTTDSMLIRTLENKIRTLSLQMSVLSNQVWQELHETRTLNSVEEGLLLSQLQRLEALSNSLRLNTIDYERQLLRARSTPR